MQNYVFNIYAELLETFPWMLPIIQIILPQEPADPRNSLYFVTEIQE